jgi:hypothetical protein
MAKIVNTDNFGGDYPNERFVKNLPVFSPGQPIPIRHRFKRAAR